MTNYLSMIEKLNLPTTCILSDELIKDNEVPKIYDKSKDLILKSKMPLQVLTCQTSH